MDADAVRKVAVTFVTGTTNPPAPRPRRLMRGRVDLIEIADLITALICFAAANSWLTDENARHPRHAHSAGILILVALVISAPLVLRTRLPVSAWLASALAIIAVSVLVPPRVISTAPYIPVSVLVYYLCLYAVVVRAKLRIVLTAILVTVAGGSVADPRTAAAAIFLTAIPVLLGAVVRSRRSSVRQLAEQERRHSGERALLEERQRIARELHDVVAHHMSVIAIQAEAAPYKMAGPPPELVECFGEIRASALTGLGELRRLLGVLRTGEADTSPQPGLDGLDALLDSARSGGVTITVTCSGSVAALPDGVDLSAYRILQEALSNAIRHAPGSHVDVRLTYRPGDLALQVRNDAGASGGAQLGEGGGHGLVGMRERTSMLGGSLQAGPTGDGGFEVTAVLPVDGSHQEGAP